MRSPEPAPQFGSLGPPASGARARPDRPVHEPVDEDRLQAELEDGVLEGRDGLLGRVGGDLRHRRQAVGVGPVHLGAEGVQRPAGDLAHLGVLDRRGGQRAARVEHGEVDAEIAEALVEEPRELRGGAIQGVGRRQAPPGRARRPVRAPLGLREPAPGPQHRLVVVDASRLLEALREVAPALRLHVLAHELHQHGPGLDEVPVGVDDGVAEARAQRGGRGSRGCRCRGGSPRPSEGRAPRKAASASFGSRASSACGSRRAASSAAPARASISGSRVRMRARAQTRASPSATGSRWSMWFVRVRQDT